MIRPVNELKSDMIDLRKIVEVPINGSNPPHYSHINRPWLQL